MGISFRQFVSCRRNSEFSRRLESLYGPDGAEDDEVWEVVDRATDWVRRRRFDSAHLVEGPVIAILSDAEAAHIGWKTNEGESDPTWTACMGAFGLPREAFIREVEDFNDRLMAAMAARVEAVLNGALSPEIEIDLDRLVQQQEERAREIEAALRPLEPQTDWGAVRTAIRKIEAMPL